jgi:O-antigen biosynthesis protein
MLKKVIHLARSGGLPALSRKLKRRLSPTTWSHYSEMAASQVSQYDFSSAQLAANLAVQDAHPGAIAVRSITWFLPAFKNPFFGGVMTILRFADYYKKEKNVSHHFVITDAGDPEPYREMIVQAFPGLEGEAVSAAGSVAEVEKLGGTDIAIATYWTTSFYQLLFNQTRRKFYFVQDYEPSFYPAGTTSAQVLSSYRFGYYGIGNTSSVASLYAEASGRPSESFVPAVDTKVFYAPASETERSSDPYLLFFYGRPENTRNAFELGIAALKRLKERMGGRVRIVAAGHGWDAADYGVETMIENLGLLKYEETARLYRTCTVGLAMMATPHPSYLPFEFMATGCLSVALRNPGTDWFFKHRENCLLSEASVSCLAETLEQALCDDQARQEFTRRALAGVKSHYSDWTPALEKIFKFICDPKVPL